MAKTRDKILLVIGQGPFGTGLYIDDKCDIFPDVFQSVTGFLPY